MENRESDRDDQDMHLRINPEPEGGYTATCPALPGLVTYGETLQEARDMALDAMEGLIEVMLEQGETGPESDTAEPLRASAVWLIRCRARPSRSLNS